MSIALVDSSRVQLPAFLGGGEVVADDNELILTVSIAPSDQCDSWPQLLRNYGWRAFAKRETSATCCARTQWLLKCAEHVFAFQQLDRAECPQTLRLPAACAPEILGLFEEAGLLAH
jgi:hypothetical protein